MSNTPEINENFNQIGTWDTPNNVVIDDEIEYKPLFSVGGIQWHFNNLLGNVLTTIDASITDPIQRKAVKDIMKRHVWAMMTEVREEAYNPRCGSAGSVVKNKK